MRFRDQKFRVSTASYPLLLAVSKMCTRFTVFLNSSVCLQAVDFTFGAFLRRTSRTVISTKFRLGLWPTAGSGAVAHYILGLWPTAYWGCCPLYTGAVARCILGLWPTAYWDCYTLHTGAVVHCILGLWSTAYWDCGPLHTGAVAHCILGLWPTAYWGCGPLHTGAVAHCILGTAPRLHLPLVPSPPLLFSLDVCTQSCDHYVNEVGLSFQHTDNE
jgi:hypothetical protein